MKTFKALLAAAAVIAMIGCSSDSSGSSGSSDSSGSSSNSAAAVYNPGTYEGKAEGHNGEIGVAVTVSESAITNIIIIDHEETDGICDPAFEQIPDAIIKANSASVDTVSGCTDSSEGIINAVKAALAEAKR